MPAESDPQGPPSIQPSCPPEGRAPAAGLPLPEERRRHEAHGISRDVAAAMDPFSGPSSLGATRPRPGAITVEDQGDRLLIRATGPVVFEVARQLADELLGANAADVARIHLDLTEATTLDPGVVGALLQAWERRGRTLGTIQIAVSEGHVGHYLRSLGLDRALELVSGDAASTTERRGAAPPVHRPEEWELAREGALEHLRTLLESVRRRHLAELRHRALELNTLCAAAGALPDAQPDFARRCARCPLHHQFGGCGPVLERAVRAAGAGAWLAAEHYLLGLEAETRAFVAPSCEAGDAPG